jgi:archaellum component FlaF (FlaF/FlaG flagellin family)
MKKKLLSFLSLTAIAIFAFAATQSLRRAGDPVVLWSSETPVEVTWGTSVAMQDASVAADWNVGDILAITVNSFDTATDPWPQVGFKQNIEGWPNVCPLDASVKSQTMPYVSKFYITADMLAKLKANQFFISGTAATVSKLEYIKDESGTDFSNAIWIGESTYPASEWWTATAVTVDKSLFANVKAGDKIEFRLTAKGDAFILQPFLGGWSGTKINTNDDAARFTINGNVATVTLTADDATALKTGGMVLQAGDCTVRAIALIPMYAVNVATDIENGTVEVDKATAAEGETVTVTATPAAGYKLCNALARGVTTEVAVEVKNGKFTMPADAVTVSATFAQPEDIAISPESGADIYTALKAATTDAGKVAKSVTINLAKNGTYTLSNPIEGCSNIAIAGPATLADGENAPVIDAEANTGAFVKMGTPVVAANTKGFYEVDNFAIKNVNVKNIKSYVYDDNKNAFAFAEFAVENCVFEFANTKQDIDAPFRFQAGGPVKFILKNNTMYQKGTKNNRYFVKISSGNFPDKAFEAFAGPYVWDIEGNTFYQTIAHGDGAKMAFINGGRVGNNFAKTSITIKKNIFIDCAGSESFLKDLFGGKSTDSDRAKFVKIDTDLNTYRTDGTAIDVSKYDKGMILTTDPSFKDAANGDFTLGATTAQARMKTGDPRWLVDYVAPAEAKVQDIEFTAEPGDISRQLTAKKSEIINALNDVGNITINLAADGAYTISAPIEAGGSVTINGAAGAKIDASALTDAFIKMSKTPAVAKVTSGQYVVTTPAKIENVKITGLTKSIYTDNGIEYAFETFTINNCVFEYETQASYVLDFSKSMAINFNIINSTFYSKTSGTANFISLSGKRPWQITGYEVETGKLTVDHSTFYNLAKSKQFLNTNTLKGQKYLYVMNSNIFVDCSNKKIYGNMTNNAKQVTTDSKNTYMFDGVFFAETGNNGDAGLQTDPAFKDAANGDFTLGASTVQAKYETGDPRWKVAFTGGYTITMGTVTNGTVEAGGTSPYAAGEKVRLTLTPAEGYAIDNKPTFKNDEDVDVTELVTVGQDADGFYLVMPAFNITASYAFSKLYTITLPTETTHGTITIVKPEGTNKSVAGKLIKIKVTGLSDGYKVVAKNGDTDITLNEGDHATYDYYFEMPEGDVTISIVDATGINAISVDGAADIFADGKPVYNLAGQRVFKGYKGLVIKNGKKVVVK